MWQQYLIQIRLESYWFYYYFLIKKNTINDSKSPQKHRKICRVGSCLLAVASARSQLDGGFLGDSTLMRSKQLTIFLPSHNERAPGHECKTEEGGGASGSYPRVQNACVNRSRFIRRVAHLSFLLRGRKILFWWMFEWELAHVLAYLLLVTFSSLLF